jgi:hypothetical protein
MTAFPKPTPKKTANQILREAMKKPSRSTSNKRSLCRLNHSHRSKLESAVCQLLQFRQAAKEIEILQVEDHVYLTRARIGYVADFKCRDLRTGDVFHVEAKGHASDHWKTIRKLWPYYGPNRLEIWIGDHDRPRLDQIIIPGIKIWKEIR